MSNGININNLEGSVKAFADAADQNNDGIIDQKEQKLFNQFINATGLTQDEGLKVERQRAAQNNVEVDVKKAQKDEEKFYNAYFGKKEVNDVKSAENEANRRVIRAFNELKGAKSPQALNDAIAGRPDMADYSGDAESYKKALDSWALNVETALNKSTVEQINSTVVGVGAAIITNDNLNAAALTQMIADGTATIAKEIKTAEGNIEQTVKDASGQVIKVVKNSAGQIIRVVREESAETKNLIIDYGEANLYATNIWGQINNDEIRYQGEKTREHVSETADETQNVIRNTAEETQELDVLSKRVSDNINNMAYTHTEETINAVANMRTQIVSSDLSHEEKTALLTHLGNFSTQIYINSKELAAEQQYIDAKIREYDAVDE
ncbi:MAG: hypothetical protein LUB59_05575 [Candidatus Gastranaerophilales bacterium]|nr:hypothetical protein [Candidatus Gastranaerophilales bacterium]